MNVLANKSYRSTSYISRYSNLPYYYHTLDNKYIVGTAKWLKDTTSAITHIVKQGDTFDTLALKYYNNPTLYWIICSFNRINDPYIDLEIGSEIKIPSLSTIEFEDI